MPICCPASVRDLDAHDFKAIDYFVMGHAFASQNDLGRLCDECVYEGDMRMRLIEKGHSVETQLPLKVSHKTFAKVYRLDLVVNGALFELKANTAFAGQHESQLLNYMFLLGIRRAKLLNFRPRRVQGKILATSLTTEQRRRFEVVDRGWRQLTAGCARLRENFLELLEDWGAFLDLELYQEALVTLLEPGPVEQQIVLSRGKSRLGRQRMLLCAPGCGFRITAQTQNRSDMESSLRRLLHLTDLKAFHWFNLNHAQIELATLFR